MPKIRQHARLPFNKERDQIRRLFPFLAIKREFFEIGKALGLDVVTGDDDFQTFFEFWASVEGDNVFAMSRYRPWYIEVDDPSTWKFRDSNLYSPVYTKHDEQGRLAIFTALIENLTLKSSEIFFLDDDEQIIPCPGYLKGNAKA